MSPRVRDALALVGWLAVAFLPSLLGAWFTPGPWYDGLDKPPWNPPSWLFGPVWTALYASMGVAAWLVWREAGRAATVAWTLFGVQLALNAAWSPAFFGAEDPGLALAVIVAMWLAIAGTIWAFSRHHRGAAALLSPYLAWVTFATALNAAIWQLNTV